MENWISIKGFPNYEVSDEGRVRSKTFIEVVPANRRQKSFTRQKNGKVLKPAKTGKNKDYLFVSLGRKNQRYVHRLVAENFIGEIEEGKEIDHINGIKADNRVENLRIVTHAFNCYVYSKPSDCVAKLGYGYFWFINNKDKTITVKEWFKTKQEAVDARKAYYERKK